MDAALPVADAWEIIGRHSYVTPFYVPMCCPLSASPRLVCFMIAYGLSFFCSVEASHSFCDPIGLRLVFFVVVLLISLFVVLNYVFFLCR